MKAKYGLFLILMLAAVITVSVLPCWAQGTSEEKKEEKKEDIWTDEEPRGPGDGCKDFICQDYKRKNKTI